MISKPKKSENKVQPQIIERRLFTMARAGRMLGVSEWQTRELCRKGLLPSVRVARKRLVDVQDIEAFIKRHKETASLVRPQDRRPHPRRSGIDSGIDKVVVAASA